MRVARFDGGASEKFAAIWRASNGGVVVVLPLKLIRSLVAGEGREATATPWRAMAIGAEEGGRAVSTHY